MNKISVTDKGILGTQENLKKLEQADEASVLVISDSHKNSTALKRILKEFSPYCDAIVFCGDGAYDFISCLEELPEVAVFVRGNGDPLEVTCDKEPFILDVPESAILNVAGKKILISHGHLYGVDFSDSLFIEEAQNKDCNIILHGHTHVPRHIYTQNKIHIICPGSITLPRGGQEKSFCILTIKGNYIDAAFKEIKTKSFDSFNPIC